MLYVLRCFAWADSGCGWKLDKQQKLSKDTSTYALSNLELDELHCKNCVECVDCMRKKGRDMGFMLATTHTSTPEAHHL